MRVVDDLFSLHPRTVFLRREALAAGYEDGDLRNLRRAGVIRSVRHGAYVSAEVHDAADELERFRLRGQAVVLSHGGRVALSHTSAAAELGIALFRPDVRHIHVVRREAGHGAIESGIRYHRRVSTGIEERPGLATVTPVEAALGAASQHGVEQGLVATDSLIDLGLATLEQLHEAYARRAHHPHSRHLRIVVRLTREGAQSPLETASATSSSVVTCPSRSCRSRCRRRWPTRRNPRPDLAKPQGTGRDRRPDQVRPAAAPRAGRPRGRAPREGAGGRDAGGVPVQHDPIHQPRPARARPDRGTRTPRPASLVGRHWAGVAANWAGSAATGRGLQLRRSDGFPSGLGEPRDPATPRHLAAVTWWSSRRS